MTTSSNKLGKLLVVGPLIVLALLVVSLGVAAKSLNGLSYEEYCKEPQAKCDPTRNTSIPQTFKNIYTTLSTGQNVHQTK